MTTSFHATRTQRRPWARPALILFWGSVLSFWVAVPLSRLTPDYREIVMIGPFSSDRAALVLFAIAFYSFGLSVIVVVTAAAVRSDSFLMAVVMALLWIVALPIGLIGSGVLALLYAGEPGIHRFSLADEQYLLTTYTGVASDENSLAIFRQDGSRYILEKSMAMPSATTEIGPDGIRFAHDVDGDWIEYPGTDGHPQRYRVR